MRVIVIGGGAVGLCVAEQLVSRGVEVTVLERDRCGAGASEGNAGWITPSLSIPVPGPGVIGASLRWLIKPSGPLWIRPTLSATMLAWIAAFVVNCRRPVYRRGLATLQRAAALAGAAFDRLASRGGEFELHEDQLLFPVFDSGELEHLCRTVEELRRAGARQSIDRLSRGEVVALEPALESSVLGGILADDERRVRPESLTAGLHRMLVSRGAEVLEQSPATSIRRDGPRWLVESYGWVGRGDAVVIAGGVDSVRLLAELGMRLPIVAAKGYSRTYPRDPTGPRRPLYLEGPKVAISVFDNAVRVSGTLELGARSLALSSRRLAAITAAARRALPSWQMTARPSDWAGMRPLSPDGLPFVGPVPGADGVHIASAHAMLGITLAPLTGELLAASLLDHRADELLAAFDPRRALRLLLRPAPSRGGSATAGRADGTRQQPQEEPR